jgi:hypothetical protein
VPRHAEACLKRLFGIEEPYQDVKQFQADLAATHDRPAEVSRSRRFAHLGILAFLMFFGLGFYIVPFFMSPGKALAGNLARQIQSGKHARANLHAGAARDLAASLLNAAAPVRLTAAGQWHSDMILESRLSGELESWRIELDGRLKALGWAGNLIVDMSQGDPGQNPFVPFAGWHGFRGQAQGVLDADAQRRGQGTAMIAMLTMVPLVMILMWPALWVLWALATRGGFSYRVAGIALVHSDGRRPSHLRCAWRSLLFWAPLTALLVLSILLDAWFWREWEAAGNGANLSPWLTWLSSAAWGAAALLLPIYAGLALLCPGRSLHDRIAGTCLVPR